MSEFLKNNSLIAKFMGYRTWTTNDGEYMCEVDGFVGRVSDFSEIQYNQNFNLILKVADKIESLGYKVSFSSYQAQVYDSRRNLIIDADFFNTFFTNGYDCIIAFIEFFIKKQNEAN